MTRLERLPHLFQLLLLHPLQPLQLLQPLHRQWNNQFKKLNSLPIEILFDVTPSQVLGEIEKVYGNSTHVRHLPAVAQL